MSSGISRVMRAIPETYSESYAAAHTAVACGSSALARCLPACCAAVTSCIWASSIIKQALLLLLSNSSRPLSALDREAIRTNSVEWIGSAQATARAAAATCHSSSTQPSWPQHEDPPQRWEAGQLMTCGVVTEAHERSLDLAFDTEAM